MATRPRSAPKNLQSSSKEPICCCKCGLKKTRSTLSPSPPPPLPPSPSLCTIHQSVQQLHDTLIDKDLTVQSLSDQVNRLSSFERECVRKDSVINELREEIATLQKTLTNKSIKIVPVEEELLSVKETLKDRDYEIQQLNNTVSELTSKLDQSSHSVDALRTQLSHKSSLISLHCEELRSLKREKRFTDDSLSTANDLTKEKQTTISSLQERVKRLRVTNADLTTKLESIQRKYTESLESEQSLRDEIRHMKTNTNQIKQQLSSTQEQLNTSKLTVASLNTRLSTTTEQLEQMCHQLRGLVSVQSSSSKHCPVSPDTLLSNVSCIIKEQLQLKRNHLQLKEEYEQLQEEHHELNERYNTIQHDIDAILKCLSTVQPLSPLPQATITLHTSLQHLTVHPPLSHILHTLTNLSLTTNTLHNELTSLSSLLRDTLQPLQPHRTFTDKSASTLVECILEEVHTNSTMKKQYEDRISALSSEQEELLREREERVRESCTTEWREKMELHKVELSCLKEKEQLELINEIETKYQQKELQKQLEIELINKQLQEKEKELTVKGKELVSLDSSFNELNKANEHLLIELDALKESMIEQEKQHSDELLIVTEQKDSTEHQLNISLTEYKTQCQEHASTIVSLESKLIKSLQEVEEWKLKEHTVRSKLTSLQQELDTLNTVTQSSQNKTQSVLDVLRRQLSHANEASERERRKREEKEKEIIIVKETFEEEIIQLKTLHQSQLVDLREQLASRETTLVDMMKSIKETPPTTSPSPSPPTQDHTPSNEPVDDKPHPSTETLVTIGHRCLGDNHTRVIESQRHALHEMRQRMDELMRTHPPVPSHQAALKELAKIRQELVQIKTDQIIREEEEKRRGVEPVTVDISHVTSGRSQQELELEESLKESEEAYHQLVIFLCDKLNIPRPPEFKPLSGATNKVARQHVLEERNEFVTGTLKESLTALRRRHQKLQADPPNTTTDTSVLKDSTVTSTTIGPPTPDLSPYGVYSNEVLERLDQEKRLQEAIAKRKDYKSQSKQFKVRRRSHSCMITPDEMQHRIDQIHHSYSQKLDKKSAEITQLKQDLQTSQIQSNAVTAKMKDLSPYGAYSNEVLERLDQEKRLQEAIAKRKDYKSQSKQFKVRRRSHSCMITPDEMQHRIDQIHHSYSQKLDKKSAEITQLKQDLQSSQIQSNAVTAKMKVLKTK